MITEPAVDFLFFLNCALFLVVVFISIAHCGSLSGTTGEKSDPVIYKRLTGANLGFLKKKLWINAAHSVDFCCAR